MVRLTRYELKSIFDDIIHDPIFSDCSEDDLGFIKSQCEFLLTGVIDVLTFRDNINSLKNGDKFYQRIYEIIQKHLELMRPKPNLRIDELCMRYNLLGKFEDWEDKTSTTVPDPLIELHKHHRGWTKPKKKPLLTIIIPPWNNKHKLHKQIIDAALKRGPVYELLWRKEAISGDVDTTADSFSLMIKFVYKTLLRAKKECDDTHGLNGIRIITCSAGVALATGALKLIYDRSKLEGDGGANRITFKLIKSVVLVGMADNFTYCYLYGTRTKHMGDAALKIGWTVPRIKQRFSHMNPIDGLEALNAIARGGEVIWITSSADTYFPERNQRIVLDAVKSTGSLIKAKDIPEIGHIGISAAYYVFCGGIFTKKKIMGVLARLTSNKTANLFDKLMLPARIAYHLTRFLISPGVME